MWQMIDEQETQLVAEERPHGALLQNTGPALHDFSCVTRDGTHIYQRAIILFYLKAGVALYLLSS